METPGGAILARTKQNGQRQPAVCRALPVSRTLAAVRLFVSGVGSLRMRDYHICCIFVKQHAKLRAACLPR
jgi:hypothetical protein